MGGSITESEALRELRLAETIFSHSVSCLVILDRHYNFIRVNRAYAQACRRDINEFAGHNHFDLFPSDAKLIFDEVVATKRPFTTITRAFEFSDQPERGVTYWDWTLVPVLDAQGEVEFLVFSLVEVTERKRAEEALRVAALVYQHSSEAMMVSNADNQIIAVNHAFTQLMGYGATELLGQTPRMLQSGKQSTAFYQAMWESLDSTGHWQGELWDKSKAGDPIALRLAINTLFDAQGRVDRRVALFSDITEKKRADALIWDQAHFDALTKLPNRYLFTDKLGKEIVQARANGAALAVLLIDLDQFKEVNDTLGHDKGDLLLVQVARRMQACLSECVTVARLGGDEFAVILNVDRKQAGEVAQQIIDQLAAPYHLDVETVFISASIGIALPSQDGADMDELLRHADQAMYAAKAAGRNGYCYFAPSMQTAVRLRLLLTNDLRLALAGNQFELYYQPIVDLATGAIVKAEALLRWNHPTRGMVSPAEFIPVAEASGLIIEIGNWVFMQATEATQNLRRLGFTDFQIGINVSPVQFRADADLCNTWISHLSDIGLAANRVVLEITEGLLLDMTPQLKEKLSALHRAGLQLSLDDFGTGYSSLAYLRIFDIDYLKIDQSFVQNLLPDSDDQALCEAIIVMAHKLGLKVVAEGVETTQQRALLTAAGCDFAQGYLYAKPIPANQFMALLR